MVRRQFVKRLGGSTYMLIWECLSETAHLSCEYVELSVDGRHMGGWYAFGYEAAKERFDDLRSIFA